MDQLVLNGWREIRSITRTIVKNGLHRWIRRGRPLQEFDEISLVAGANYSNHNVTDGGIKLVCDSLPFVLVVATKRDHLP